MSHRGQTRAPTPMVRTPARHRRCSDPGHTRLSGRGARRSSWTETVAGRTVNEEHRAGSMLAGTVQACATWRMSAVSRPRTGNRPPSLFHHELRPTLAPVATNSRSGACTCAVTNGRASTLCEPTCDLALHASAAARRAGLCRPPDPSPRTTAGRSVTEKTLSRRDVPV